MRAEEDKQWVHVVAKEVVVGDTLADDSDPTMKVAGISTDEDDRITFHYVGKTTGDIAFEPYESVCLRRPLATPNSAPPPPPISPLPTSSAARKDFPLWTGALEYAPAAFALMARTSVNGNRKHNPGEPLHHARGKSPDHKDCILRHLTDYVAMLAYRARFGADSVPLAHLEEELGNLVWRAAMFAQEEAERLGIAPRAPRAVLPSETAATALEGR